MFHLVSRNLKFSVFKTTSVHILFPGSLCSSTAASDNSFAVCYLLDSCGIPPEKVISVSKYLKFKTPDRADSVIAFFKNQGFTETQISLLVRKFPLALTCNPEKNFLPKFEFLSSIGFSDSDIAKLLSARPKFLGRSLKNYIEPTFNLLKDLFQSYDRTLIAIRRCAWIWDLNFQANVIPKMQILRDVGVPGSKMLHHLISQPIDFLATTNRFKKTVEKVVEMGFDPSKVAFMVAVHVLMPMSKSSWEKKMETYGKWGWSEDQILQAFRTYPWCMQISEEKINKVMDVFVNKMGFDTSFIAKNSYLISYSLEKRIIPRSLVYQYCLDNGLVKGKNHRGFSCWLKSSQDTFINRLKRYEKKGPGVLKFYQEKLDHAN